MPKRGFGCERPECSSSTNIADEVSFGTGELDFNGFWEFPCKKCEDDWIMLFGSLSSTTLKCESYGITTA